MSCEFHPNRLYKLLSNQESLPGLLGQDDRCDSLIPQAVCSLYHPVIKSQFPIEWNERNKKVFCQITGLSFNWVHLPVDKLPLKPEYKSLKSFDSSTCGVTSTFLLTALYSQIGWHVTFKDQNVLGWYIHMYVKVVENVIIKILLTSKMQIPRVMRKMKVFPFITTIVKFTMNWSHLFLWGLSVSNFNEFGFVHVLLLG